MKVLVDTSVWSLAFRKNVRNETEENVVQVLAELVRDTNILIIGPIRQEILSGIKSISVFNALRDKLSIFNDLEIQTRDFETAASFFNLCRSHEIQGSHTDFLICALSVNYNVPIFTLDHGFQNYKSCLPIRTLKLESI